MNRAGFSTNNFKNKNGSRANRIPDMVKGGTPISLEPFLRLN